MRFYEFQTLKLQKPLTPAQTRIKSLKDQAKHAQAAVKAEQARQKIAKAQQSLNQLESFNIGKRPFKAQFKQKNAYNAWQTIGSYGNFNDALNSALRKKRAGAAVVRIEDGNKWVLYSN